MELEGVLVKVLDVVKGTSARGEWSKQEIVIELKSEFNKKVCVSFWGDKVQDVAAMREGDTVNLSINIESREYNGRWFTEVRAWRVNKGGVSTDAPTAAAAPQRAPQPSASLPPLTGESFDSAPSSGDTDDLPF